MFHINYKAQSCEQVNLRGLVCLDIKIKHNNKYKWTRMLRYKIKHKNSQVDYTLLVKLHLTSFKFN